MSSNNEEKKTPNWHHPSEVMKIHKLKLKKKALQARIKGNVLNDNSNLNPLKKSVFDDIFSAKKRKNPFIIEKDPKKIKCETSGLLDESSDQTLFRLLHQNNKTTCSQGEESFTSFGNIINKLKTEAEPVEVVKAQGKKWLPIDWALKKKIRLLSTRPFPWTQKLKICEEASGITAFSRCLDNSKTETTLDTSPNAKFHQCCLYWQQPSLPWLSLFPRNATKNLSTTNSVAVNKGIKDSLQSAWSDSLRSLFQLIRIKQCPYFYACANNFTVLFRAAGICGFSDIHALVTPTTRGLRQMLRQEEIEFTMPLKGHRMSDGGYECLESANAELGPEIGNMEEDIEAPDDHWLKSMGINLDDIKQINFMQEKIKHKNECEVDNSEQSLILIEGVEVHSFYNFLINCKSATSFTGPLAGIPPTLLAPVAFQGASLQNLKVRENKVHLDDVDYYALELTGPILPTTIHNLFAITSPEHSLTATFNNVVNTENFSKLENDKPKSEIDNKGTIVFGKENLTDCGLLPTVLKHFCTSDSRQVVNIDCLKYTSENQTFTWT